MLKEFKDFIAGGSVMDMAVGIILGGATTAIVTSLVDDMIMPIVGLFMGGVDFSALGTELGSEENLLAWGNFLMAVINFLIIAFVVFMLVKMVNSLKKPEVEEDPGPSQEDLLGEIRDLLSK